MTKYQKTMLVLAAVAAFASLAFAADEQLTKAPPGGTSFGQSSTDKISFYNATTVVQPSGAAQTALTDNSGGTAAPTTGVSANAQKLTVVLPSGVLAGFANGQTWKVAVPYAFQINSCGFRVGVPATTASKAATLTLGISGVTATGGVIALTTAALPATGLLQSSSAITANNTGAAGSTIDFVVSSVTTFSEGSGYVECNVTNVDKANESSTFAALSNAIRSALVALGLVKGSS